MPKGIKPSAAEAPAPISSRRVVAIGRSLGYALPTMRASDRQHLPKQSFSIVSMRLAKKEATLTQPCVGQRDGACCSRREAEFSQVDGGKKRCLIWVIHVILPSPHVRFAPRDGVIGRRLVDSRRFWVLRFRLMVKRGPWLRPQASDGEAP